MVVESCGEKICGSTLPEISHDLEDVLIGLEHQAVTAQDDIYFWDWLAAQIQGEKYASWRSELFLGFRHQLRHYIRAGVFLDGEIDLLHPVEIAAARIEDGADPQVLKQQRQPLPDLTGGTKGGAWSGEGLVSSLHAEFGQFVENIRKRM